MLTLLKPYGDISIEEPLIPDNVSLIGLSADNEKDRELELMDKLHEADMLIGDIDLKITKNLLGQAPNLRAVICRSIGVDYIDLEAASQQGVLVVNSPDFCTIAVAEYAVTLLLSLAHRIPEAQKAIDECRWDMREELRGVELAGRTLGLIGFGKIGREVARRAIGLQMNVIAYDPYAGAEMRCDKEVQMVSLEQLLSGSDAISLHVPLTPKTKGMLGREELSLIKDGTIIINVARGGIVDEEALIEEVSRGRLWAAIDVFTSEPPSLDLVQKMKGMKHLISTPHVAWNSEQAAIRNQEIFSKQLRAIASGILPPAIVNPQISKIWLQQWGYQ